MLFIQILLCIFLLQMNCLTVAIKSHEAAILKNDQKTVAKNIDLLSPENTDVC